MPNFLSEDRDALRERLRGLMSATDENGNPLFPDQDTPGSPGYTLREMFLRLLETHHQQVNTMAEDFSPRTATGSSLDQWANYFGMQRGQASAPSGTVLLTSEVSGAALDRLNGSREIPVGLRLRAGGVELEVTQNAAFPEDGTETEIEVETALTQDGTAVRRGADVSVPQRQNVTGEALTDISGGRRSESDEQLRFRLSRALRAPSSFEGLRARMLGNEDVDTVEIEEAAYGPGTARVHVNPAVAYPTRQLREQLESLATEGPSRVYVTFPAYEGITLQIKTIGPEPADAKQAVVDYVTNLEGGDTLIINEVEERIRDRGARDAQVLAARRGMVGEGRALLNPRQIQQVTNLQPADGQTQWYTKSDWITLCE